MLDFSSSGPKFRIFKINADRKRIKCCTLFSLNSDFLFCINYVFYLITLQIIFFIIISQVLVKSRVHTTLSAGNNINYLYIAHR